MYSDKNTKEISMYYTVDLFSGAGGITEGFRKQGNFTCVCASDCDPCAKETFTYNHPGAAYILKDIRELTGDEIKEAIKDKCSTVDVITGGPPCQGFSLAGQRLADDPRNMLFREYIRIAKALQPKVIFFENVYGILSMQKGNVLKAIIAEFDEIGFECQYKIINAAEFGVPQARPRFVLIGVRKGNNVKISFPEPTHGQRNDDDYQIGFFQKELLPFVTVEDALSDLPVLDQGQGASEMLHTNEPVNDFQRARRGERKPGIIFGHKATKHSKEIQYRYSLIPQGCTNACLPEEIRTKKNNVYKLDMTQPARTVTCNFRTDLLHPTMNRGLTVREAARLQSFDDDYRFFGCLTRKARWLTQDDQVGNAVPPLLAQAFANHIAKKILPQFEKKEYEK